MLGKITLNFKDVDKICGMKTINEISCRGTPEANVGLLLSIVDDLTSLIKISIGNLKGWKIH